MVFNAQTIEKMVYKTGSQKIGIDSPMHYIKNLGINLSWTVLSILLSTTQFYSSALADQPSNLEQRQAYKKALSQLSKGQIAKFNKTKASISSYPLVDYLEYHKFNRLLHKRSATQMSEFKKEYAHLPVAALTEKRWLKLIGRQRQWKIFQENYTSSSDPELQCLYARSLYGTNQKVKAMELTENLWTKPKSQPKVCDPLFEVWKKTKHFSEDVVWSRLKLTVQNNQRQLSRYLLRFLSGSNKQIGLALYQAHTQPNRISKFKSLGASKAKERHVIIYGLSRLSTKDADHARKIWERLSPKYLFTDKEIQTVNSAIILGLSQENDFPSEKERLPLLKLNGFSSKMANAAIQNANWAEIDYWAKHANNDEKNIKWDYWLARAKIELGQTASGNDLLEQISNQRHYYGFMAANRLNRSSNLNDASLTHLTDYQASNPRVLRTKELFAVGDDINGRREWYASLSELSEEEKLHSLYFLNGIGRTALTIRTANKAGAQDHLALRFPKLYQQEFRSAALTTDLSLPLLYAVARQESAFNPQAVSTANARGLMQLIPSTAKLSARRMGLSSPSVTRLHEPGLNIKLGSFHLGWLVERFDGQTALAVAAYNAGEKRVDRWTKNKKQLALDVWVEQIPFKETRNYVKNVLAFRQVYSELLGQPEPFLSPKNLRLR